MPNINCIISQLLSAYIFYPLALAMGIDAADSFRAGMLLGYRLAVNNLVAFLEVSLSFIIFCLLFFKFVCLFLLNDTHIRLNLVEVHSNFNPRSLTSNSYIFFFMKVGFGLAYATKANSINSELPCLADAAFVKYKPFSLVLGSVAG